MNHQYRVVFNESTQTWTAVAEIASAKGKKSQTAKIIAVGLASLLFSNVAMVEAETIKDNQSWPTSNTSYLDAKRYRIPIIYGGDANGRTAGVAVGYENIVNLSQGVALGFNLNRDLENTPTLGAQATAIGNNTDSTGYSSIAIGGDDIDPYRRNTDKVAEFKKATGIDVSAGEEYIRTKSSGTGSIAIGAQSRAVDDVTIALGMRSLASGFGAVVLGAGSVAEGQSTLALGTGSSAKANRALALGTGSSATVEDSIALGTRAKVNHTKSVALGTDAITTGAVSDVSATVNSNGKTITFENFAGVTGNGKEVVGVVSVGNANQYRQIQNLAAGKLAADSTDAVNGSQLFRVGEELAKVKSQIEDGSLTIAGNIGGDKLQALDKKLIIKGGGTGKDDVYSDSNIKTIISQDTDKNNTLTIKLANAPTFTGNVTAAGFQVNNGPLLNSKGLDMKSTAITNVLEGTIELNGKNAATTGQLFTVQQKASGTFAIKMNEEKKAISDIGLGDSKAITFKNGTNTVATVTADTSNTGVSRGAIVQYNLSKTLTGLTSVSAKNITAEGEINGGSLKTAGAITGQTLTTTGNIQSNGTVSGTTLSAGGVTVNDQGIQLGNKKITGLATPINNTDAATKGYVDTEITNKLKTLPAAQGATTVNGTNDQVVVNGTPQGGYTVSLDKKFTDKVDAAVVDATAAKQTAQQAEAAATTATRTAETAENVANKANTKAGKALQIAESKLQSFTVGSDTNANSISVDKNQTVLNIKGAANGKIITAIAANSRDLTIDLTHEAKQSLAKADTAAQAADVLTILGLTNNGNNNLVKPVGGFGGTTKDTVNEAIKSAYDKAKEAEAAASKANTKAGGTFKVTENSDNEVSSIGLGSNQAIRFDDGENTVAEVVQGANGGAVITYSLNKNLKDIETISTTGDIKSAGDMTAAGTVKGKKVVSGSTITAAGDIVSTNGKIEGNTLVSKGNITSGGDISGKNITATESLSLIHI